MKYRAEQFNLFSNMTTQDKRRPVLFDDDLMPFGRYKGEYLSDVPASYLHWLWHNTDIQENNLAFANYIWNCQDSIRKELGDSYIPFE